MIRLKRSPVPVRQIRGVELASRRKTPECEYDAYCKIIDYADMILAAYDPTTARGDAVDRAMEYAKERGLPVMFLPPNAGR